MRYLFLMLSILFIACTPQQRLNRLVKNHPELIKIDSITVHDTIIDPGFALDSIFPLIYNDTVFITKYKTDIKLVRGKGDTVRLYIKQPPDTIVRVTVKEVPKIVIQKDSWLTWVKDHKGWLIAIGIIIGILILIRFIVKLFK